MFQKEHFYEHFSSKKKTIFYLFRTLSETFLAFCRKLIGEVVKTAFYVSHEYFQEKWILWKVFSFVHQCRTSSEIFLAFCRDIFVDAVKTAFYVSIGTFWWKTFFFEKVLILVVDRIFFGVFWEFLGMIVIIPF